MLKITVDNSDELAVVECTGRLVQRDAACRLREVVTSQEDVRFVVLDLSQVIAIEEGGFGMLVFLQRWARDRNIRFMLFDPSKCVRDGLKRVRAISEFYIPTLDNDGSLRIRRRPIRVASTTRLFVSCRERES